jgi:hypothetical protein
MRSRSHILHPALFAIKLAAMLPRMLLSDPSEWSLDEVRELISGQVPEGQRLDYKRELHLDNKAQKAEVAKDISGMANAQGGWIVFGVSEDESPEPLPSEITPVPADGNTDAPGEHSRFRT